jgi:hypothetical protein
MRSPEMLPLRDRKAEVGTPLTRIVYFLQGKTRTVRFGYREFATKIGIHVWICHHALHKLAASLGQAEGRQP